MQKKKERVNEITISILLSPSFDVSDEDAANKKVWTWLDGICAYPNPAAKDADSPFQDWKFADRSGPYASEINEKLAELEDDPEGQSVYLAELYLEHVIPNSFRASED